MAEVIWSNAAITAIESIAEYIGSNSLKYAQLTVDQIFKRVTILETQPYSGHVVPEISDPTIREIHYKSYRIIYRVSDESKVYIITIHHFSKPLEEGFLNS